MPFRSLPFLLLFTALRPLAAQTDLGRILPADQPVRIVAFGDFGTGSRNQKAVARAIAQRHQQEPFSFGLTMGDNFYRCGVSGLKDPKWESRWEALYTPLKIPFYATLGNHDYGHPPVICPMRRGSPNAEILYSQRSESWRMPARYYTFAAGPVRFFAIDTEGWNPRQLQWIRQALADSAQEEGVKWRIVYGHHPIYTSGVHLNQRRIGRLRRELLPVLRAAKVDLYLAGHDHDMEHLRVDGMEFVICGTGGAELRRVKDRLPESLFDAAQYGFVSLFITEDTFAAEFLGTALQSLEKVSIEK